MILLNYPYRLKPWEELTRIFTYDTYYDYAVDDYVEDLDVLISPAGLSYTIDEYQNICSQPYVMLLQFDHSDGTYRSRDGTWIDPECLIITHPTILTTRRQYV